MESRPCPVCRKGKVWLPHVRTCSHWCSRTWKTWSPEMQASAVEASLGTSTVLIDDAVASDAEISKDKPEFLK